MPAAKIRETGLNCRALVATLGSWQLHRARSVLTVATRSVLRLSSMAMVHDAVLAGLGAAAIPRSLVQADIDAGRLIEWRVVAVTPSKSGRCIPRIAT